MAQTDVNDDALLVIVVALIHHLENTETNKRRRLERCDEEDP
jgi:hypothetical protein